MTKLFVVFSTKAGFNSATLGKEYDNNSIVFIKDTKEIWAKGVLFPAVTFDITEYAKVDALGDYYTKAEMDAELAKKLDAAIAASLYVTKEYAEETYLKVHQSLENYYTKAEVDGLIEGVDVSEQLVAYPDAAEYVSTSKEIQFKHNGTVLTGMTIDATAFIKDGMVSNVEVKEGNLEITFNEDSGKETIKVAISDIFNASNYYTKTEVDGELAKKVDVSAYTEDKATFETKANAEATYVTKTYAEETYLKEHQSLAEYAKSADVTSEISDAVDGLSDEIDGKFEGYYTQEEVDAMFEWGEY